MGQLLVRGLDDDVIIGLKQRAARSGRSVEAEHRSILEAAVADERESFAAAAARLRTEGPALTTDGADIIRAFRDRDWKQD